VSELPLALGRPEVGVNKKNKRRETSSPKCPPASRWKCRSSFRVFDLPNCYYPKLRHFHRHFLRHPHHPMHLHLRMG